MFLILSLLFSNVSHATFAPENDLHIEDAFHSLSAEMTQEQFNQIVNEVINIWKPLAEAKGATLVSENNWTSGTVNAYASQSGRTWKVAMFGGLARRPEVTPDGFALVVCHELGHHFGGFAFYGNADWAASEGQSDYFATHACAKELWGKQLTENAKYREGVLPSVQTRCDAAYSTVDAQNLCYRTSMGGHSLALLLSKLGGSSEPKFETPDAKAVPRTSTSHPAAQCRLDTYFNGALCSAPADLTVIPGKDAVAGRNSLEAETEAARLSCTTSSAHTEGLRPRCWYFPRM